MNRNVWRVLAAALVLIAGLYVSALTVVAPRIVRIEALEAIADACGQCNTEIGSVSFEFLNPGSVRFHDVKMKLGSFGGSEGLLRLKEVRVNLSLLKSRREHIVIDLIRFENPDILFVDGDAVSKKSESKEEPGPTFEIARTEISNGVFTYTRNTKGTSATLHLADISGFVSRVGSSAELKNEVVEAHLKTQIEKSGEVQLDVAALLRPGPDHVDVVVNIKDQKLDVLTPFFNPNAGVELKGEMLKGRGRVKIRDQEMEANVWAVYRGLELKLNPMYDRTEAEAFFMNLGAELVMNEDDLDKPASQQARTVHSRRENGERIVGFILRGLKEAAIRVAQAAPSDKKAK